MNQKSHYYKRKYENLQENYEELLCHLQDIESTLKLTQDELMIKNDFLSYFNLEALYVYFRDNAHEEKPDDLPFGHLTL